MKMFILLFITFYVGMFLGLLCAYMTSDHRPLSFYEYLGYVFRRLRDYDDEEAKDQLNLFHHVEDVESAEDRK